MNAILVVFLFLVVLVTGVKQSQLLVLGLQSQLLVLGLRLEFDKISLTQKLASPVIFLGGDFREEAVLTKSETRVWKVKADINNWNCHQSIFPRTYVFLTVVPWP